MLLHYVTRHAKLLGASEDLDYRTKLTLKPEDTFRPFLEELNLRAHFFGEGESTEFKWGLVSFKGDEAFEVPLDEPVSSLRLTNAMKEVRLETKTLIKPF